MNAITNALSKSFRVAGRSLDTLGLKLEKNGQIDKLQPSLKCMSYKKRVPALNCTFIASTASVIGDVSIGENSSVWYDAVIRGDVKPIKIGNDVCMGDRSLVHDGPTTIGNRVYVGAGATIHGATLEDECWIGENAVVLDKVVVKKHAIVAPGALVPPNKVVGEGEYWAGNPARCVRKATASEIELLLAKVVDCTEYATQYAFEMSKSWEQLEHDMMIIEEDTAPNPLYYKRMPVEMQSKFEGEVEYHQVPGRIFNSPISADNNIDEEGYDMKKKK